MKQCDIPAWLLEIRIVRSVEQYSNVLHVYTYERISIEYIRMIENVCNIGMRHKKKNSNGYKYSFVYPELFGRECTFV